MSLSEEGEEDGRATIGGIENIAVRRIGFMNTVTNILFGKQVLVLGGVQILEVALLNIAQNMEGLGPD